jgi:hypothetical protein
MDMRSALIAGGGGERRSASQREARTCMAIMCCLMDCASKAVLSLAASACCSLFSLCEAKGCWRQTECEEQWIVVGVWVSGCLGICGGEETHIGQSGF